MIRELTVREFFAQAYGPFRLTGRSEATTEQYDNALNHLARVCRREPALSELSADMLNQVMTDLAQRDRPATVNKVLRHIKAIWNFAHRRGQAPAVPDIERMREPKDMPRAWLQEEMIRIVDSAGQHPGEYCGLPANLWWPCLINTLYNTGLRINAMMHCRWADFDEPTRRIYVPARYQKQGQQQAPPIMETTWAALSRIRSDKWLFPWPFDRADPNKWRTLTRHLRTILDRAGLPTTSKDLFHKFRKTNASYIAAAGGNATLQLGHSSPSVTARYLDDRITGHGDQVGLLPSLGDQQLTLF